MNNIIIKQKELIELYEQYIDLLGCELRELRVIGSKNGWTSHKLKEGSLLRNKISKLKNDLKNITL